MKKNIFFLALIMFFASPLYAKELKNIEYKELKENTKISYNVELGVWTQKVNKKTPVFYTKKDMGDGTSLFVNIKDGYAFSTNCQYEFINKGRLIGYSNSDLKFYTFTLFDNKLEKKELTSEELLELFPQFKIIKLSDFSVNTNSLKIKKDKTNFKLILLNDTNKQFYDYKYTTNNAEFEEYKQRGFLNVTQKGMILFSSVIQNAQDADWYVLLIR